MVGNRSCGNGGILGGEGGSRGRIWGLGMGGRLGAIFEAGWNFKVKVGFGREKRSGGWERLGILGGQGRVWGLGFRIRDLEDGIWGSEYGVWDLDYGVWSLGFRIWD